MECAVISQTIPPGTHAPHCSSVPAATCSSGSTPTAAQATFRWHGDVDPDQLEYLIHGLLRFDAQLAAEVEDGGQPPAPDQGREFYLVPVRDCSMPWRWRGQMARQTAGQRRRSIQDQVLSDQGAGMTGDWSRGRCPRCRRTCRTELPGTAGLDARGDQPSDDQWADPDRHEQAQIGGNPA